jgi:hypothetical protein
MALGAETPLFIPKPSLSLVPVTVAAGTEVKIDSTGVSNNGVLVDGSPKIADFQVVEWAGSGNFQTYMDGASTKLSSPQADCVEGIRRGLDSYHIKNTTAGALTLYLRGM